MRPFIALLLLLASARLHGQGSEITLQNDSGTFVLHRFATGELSTKEWMDPAGRWGRSWAYDRAGRVIYERQTRRFAGHATVDFRYHPNGAVSRADYSTMPDGGIQWYRSTTTFSEDGQETGFQESGYDEHGPMMPGVQRPAPPVRKQEAVMEQRLFRNEYFVVNAYRAPVRIALRPRQTSPSARDIDATLLKGDTLLGGSFTMGEQWADPLTQVSITARPAKGRRPVAVVRTDTVQVTPEHRRYYLVLGKAR